ncbi:MAG: hypothetical protein GKS06_09765 [Acidobacteria bacterium]|nr:hypothetical protein [Acidobacteriota bacterium]
MQVLRVLKGDAPDVILIRGRLVGEDDYNDRPVPYDFVRPTGRAGACRAEGFKSGGYYLLIMRVDAGVPTPFWVALSATHEQLRPPFRHDAWFRWVFDRLKARSE